MANSCEYLSISLLLLLCISGGFGSGSTYSCDLQLLIMSSTIPLGDKHQGKLTDCTEIGWIESQKQYGLKTGESAECSKALSSKCQKTDQLTSSNDKIKLIKTIGNDAVGLKFNCTIDLDNAFKKPINVWQCGDDVIHRYYMLSSLPHPERTISKRDLTTLSNPCIQEKAISCQAPMADQMRKDGVIAVNKEKLIEQCNNVVKPAMRCLSGALRECSKSSGVNFEKMFSGITSTYDDLCDVDSQFSKDYLKHAPCMSEVDKLSLFTCAKVKAIDLFSSNRISDHTEILCCSSKIAMTCVKEVFNEHCGAEASQFRYQMEKRMLAPITPEACIDSNGNFKCSGYNSQSMSVATSTTVTPVVTSATVTPVVTSATVTPVVTSATVTPVVTSGPTLPYTRTRRPPGVQTSEGRSSHSLASVLMIISCTILAVVQSNVK